MEPRLFHKKLADAALPHLPRGASLLCGVSGGPDSVALLHGLLAVNQINQLGWRLLVAHLDHVLRPQSTTDADFVHDLTRDHRLEYYPGRIDVRAFAEEHGLSPEEAARRARYQFLHDVAVQARATHVAVAHHADDQAETILHRVVRGTGLQGLCGMTPTRPILRDSLVLLVRPMLEFTRADVLAYLDARGLPFRHDATNDDKTAATRNHLRHAMLPLLRETVNPRAARALCRLAEHARLAHEAIDSFARETLRHVRMHESPGVICLPADALHDLPRAVQSQIVVRLLDRLNLPRKEIGAERIDALLQLFQGVDRLRRIQLPGRVFAERRGPTVSVRLDNSANSLSTASPSVASDTESFPIDHADPRETRP